MESYALLIAATLVELPCGAMLIDTGGEENESFHSVPALTDYLDHFFRKKMLDVETSQILDLILPEFSTKSPRTSALVSAMPMRSGLTATAITRN